MVSLSKILAHEGFLQYLADQTGTTSSAILIELVNRYFGEEYRTWLKARSSDDENQSPPIDFYTKAEDHVNTISRYVTNTVSKYLPTTLGSNLIIWDEKQEKFVVDFTNIPQQDAQITASRIRSKKGATHWIMERRQAYIVEDIDADPLGANPMLYEAGARSYMGVPIMNNERVWGVLYAINRHKNTFTKRDVMFMQDLAQVAAIALSKVDLSHELKIANNDLNSYAHVIAYDLKVPLNTIVDNLQLIEQAVVDIGSRASTYLNMMNQVTLQTFEIIDELLVLAEFRNSEYIAFDPIDMFPIIAEVRFRLSTLIQKNEPKIIVPEEWPIVLGRASWIKVIWANFLSNAIKYGNARPIIELGFNEYDADHIRFWVRDNGAGLSADDQAQLFTNPIRLDKFSHIEGHGYGLSIVKRIVGKMGGEVGVESTVDQGSLFFFTLQRYDTTRRNDG